ncbi:MAG TPA: hypothetical protein VGI66_16240 [Streptosporangiaceae bacterium]
MLKVALAVSSVGAALVIPLAASGSATAATAATLPCSASMSVPKPAHGQSTAVRVKTTAGARVAAIAHYASSTVKKIAYANSAGRASLTFKVGDVAYGRKVPVIVHVYKGAASGKCSTSFTPTAPPKVYLAGSCRSSGDYAVCDEAGDATKPTAIQVLVTASPNQSVLVSWDVVCTAGYSAASTSGQFTAQTPIDRTIRHPFAHPDSCTIAAGAQLSSSGSLHVWTHYEK